MISTKPARYVHVLAIISGSFISSITRSVLTEPSLMLLSALNVVGYTIVAFIFGFFWPSKSWRWGIWVSSMMWVMVGLSIAFSGLGPNILKDLFLTVGSVLLSCSGGLLGAWLREKRIILRASDIPEVKESMVSLRKDIIIITILIIINIAYIRIFVMP